MRFVQSAGMYALLMGCNSPGITTSDGGATDVATPDAGVEGLPPDVVFGRYLQLWLDASEPSTITMNGTAVEKWFDRSDSTYSVHVTSMGANQTAVEVGAINGHNAVLLGPSRGSLTGTFSIGLNFMVVVAAYDNAPNQKATFIAITSADDNELMVGNPSGRSTVAALATSLSIAANSESEKDGWNDGRFHIFSFHLRDDAVPWELSVRVDGEESSTTGSKYFGSFGGRLDIGGVGGLYAGGSEAGVQDILDGRIAEVVGVGAPVTPLQIAQLSGYFQKKYGLTL